MSPMILIAMTILIGTFVASTLSRLFLIFNVLKSEKLQKQCQHEADGFAVVRGSMSV